MSRWYILDDVSNLRQLIDELTMKFELREVKKCLDEVCKDLKEAEEKTAETTMQQQDEDKARLSRRRKADQVLQDLTEDESDAEYEEEEILFKKKKRSRGAKAEAFEMPEPYSYSCIKLEKNETTFSIDDLALHLANLFWFMANYGILKLDRYDSLKTTISKYIESSSIENKLHIIVS